MKNCAGGSAVNSRSTVEFHTIHLQTTTNGYNAMQRPFVKILKLAAFCVFGKFYILFVIIQSCLIAVENLFGTHVYYQVH